MWLVSTLQMPARWFGSPCTPLTATVSLTPKVQPNKRSEEGIPRKTRNLRNTEGAMNFRERFEPLIGHFVLKYSFEWDTERKKRKEPLNRSRPRQVELRISSKRRIVKFPCGRIQRRTILYCFANNEYITETTTSLLCGQNLFRSLQSDCTIFPRKSTSWMDINRNLYKREC